MSLSLKKQSAFTLLEAMVALLIFSIGLIGLAGMQTAGMRSNQISHSRTFATNLAYDFADRIRNNPTANYVAAIGGGTAAGTCVTTTCTVAEMAAFDYNEVAAAMNSAESPLKNPVIFLTQNAAATGYLLSIAWDEGKTGQTPTGCDPPAPAETACVTINIEP